MLTVYQYFLGGPDTMSINATSLRNHFLISMPHMDDPNFVGTLTYLCEHNEQGAMGIVINRPLDITLRDILEQLQMDTPLHDEFVYAGGPVLTDRGFVLHRPAGQWQSTLAITDQISLTTSRDILASFAGPDAPQEKLVALGYAGWGAGQLEQEIADNYWLTCPASEEILFHTPHAQRFHAALASLGVDLHRLSSKAGHA